MVCAFDRSGDLRVLSIQQSDEFRLRESIVVGDECAAAAAIARNEDFNGAGQVSGIQPQPFAPGGGIGRLFGIEPQPFMVFDFVRVNGAI